MHGISVELFQEKSIDPCEVLFSCTNIWKIKGDHFREQEENFLEVKRKKNKLLKLIFFSLHQVRASQRAPSPEPQNDDETEDGMFDDDIDYEEDDTRFLDLEPEVKIHVGRNIFVVGKRLFKSVDIREYFFLDTKKLQVRTLQKYR